MRGGKGHAGQGSQGWTVGRGGKEAGLSMVVGTPRALRTWGCLARCTVPRPPPRLARGAPWLLLRATRGRERVRESKGE